MEQGLIPESTVTQGPDTHSAPIAVPIGTTEQPVVALAPTPTPEPAPAVAPAPLSRRELRLREQGHTEQTPSVPTEILYQEPVVDAAPPMPPAPPAPPAAPLPPVFSAPVSTHTGVTPASDSIPLVSTSRVVGDIATATSSLIIPETPTIDIAGPLGDTGEVVVTGQIRLPSSVSERGSLPALVDDRDDDEVMDAYVTGAIPASAKPVRASQAVSGKGDDSDIVLVRRARWGTAAVVTSLGAAVLGLSAVALLILALMTDVLG